jgi:hypothetical protein
LKKWTRCEFSEFTSMENCNKLLFIKHTWQIKKLTTLSTPFLIELMYHYL